MAISLTKGQKVDLTKTNPGLSKITVGLGWDVNKYDGGGDFDLDASVFLTGENGKCGSQDDFVFYGNLTHTSGSVQHRGDNLTGDGEGDDEQVDVDLASVPANIAKLSFVVTIYDAEGRKQNFGMVSNAFIRVVNSATQEELIRYDLSEDFSSETAVSVAELYRHGTEWKFAAIGAGYAGGLAAFCREFGIDAN